MKKRLLIASAATIVGLATASGAAFAATSSTTSPDQTLVDKIATKFNLDKSQVQQVFDETRTERQAQRQADIKAKIAQAVTDKKLTQDQADQLLAKLQQMDTLRDSLKDKTPEEQRAAMKTQMDELKQWFSDNKLSMKDLGIGHGMMGKGGMHHMGMQRDGDVNDDNQSQQ